MTRNTATENHYDGERITHTLRDGSVIDLYWSRHLGQYVTIPSDES